MPKKPLLLDDNPDYDLLLEQSMEELGIKTEAHDSIWQLGEADWNVDQDTGEIVFTSPKGMVATCPVQIIGTYNTLDGTWMWGWDNPSVDPALQRAAKRVRRYGKKHGILKLITHKLECTETEAWEFAAFACMLCQGQGAYRGPADTTLVFFAFGAATLSDG